MHKWTKMTTKFNDRYGYFYNNTFNANYRNDVNFFEQLMVV